MNAHVFQPTAGSKSPCSVCGKTRNTKAHKEAKTEVTPEVDTGMTEEELDAAVAEAEIASEEKAEPWGIPPVPDFVPNTPEQQAEVDARRAQATAEPAQEAEKAPAVETKAPAKAEPKKASKKAVEPNTVRLWVGWRISNACVLRDTTPAQRSLRDKLRAARPTSEMDRYVRLTVDELRALDEVGVEFAAQGNTGPVVYSARTMRRRIAEAISTLETTEEQK